MHLPNRTNRPVNRRPPGDRPRRQTLRHPASGCRAESWPCQAPRPKPLRTPPALSIQTRALIPVLVQTTTGSNLAARRAKIYASDKAALALQSGFRIVLHGWRQLKVKRGGKAKVWTVKEEEVTLGQVMAARAAVGATA